MTEESIKVALVGILFIVCGLLSYIRFRFKSNKWIRVRGTYLGKSNVRFGIDNEKVDYKQNYLYIIGEKLIQGHDNVNGNGLVVGKQYNLFVNSKNVETCQLDSFGRQHLITLTCMILGICMISVIYIF